jgi:hypothetical protein
MLDERRRAMCDAMFIYDLMKTDATSADTTVVQREYEGDTHQPGFDKARVILELEKKLSVDESADQGA